MRFAALLDHPESSLHSRKSRLFLFQINIVKGQHFKQIYYCVSNKLDHKGFYFDLLLY